MTDDCSVAGGIELAGLVAGQVIVVAVDVAEDFGLMAFEAPKASYRVSAAAGSTDVAVEVVVVAVAVVGNKDPF